MNRFEIPQGGGIEGGCDTPRRRGAKRQLCCHKGHPLSGPNLVVYGRLRQCRTCKIARRRSRRPREWAFRVSEPGRILARGPLDYDRPVTVRCANCGGVYETTLAELHRACPHCQRYAGAAA